MRKIIAGIAFLTGLSLSSSKLFCQVSINGPGCVTRNTMYLYTITGNFDSSHAWRLCVSGGNINETNSSCLDRRWNPFVKIFWNGDSGGSLQLTSGSGNISLQVNITTQLTGGVIDRTVLTQLTDSLTIPNALVCSVANGGGCNPSYLYQWQQSADNLTWIDITDATAQNLKFLSPVQQSAYYRRTATMQTSDAIAYSSVASIFINR